MTSPSASLSPDFFSRVASSLRLVHSSASDSSSRSSSSSFLNEIQDNFALSLALSDAILSSPLSLESSIFPYFALHLLSESLSKWPRLSSSDRSQLRQAVLNKFQSFTQLEAIKRSKPLIQKLSSLVSRVALFEYPQHWPSLVSDLLSFPVPLLSALVFAELAESISGFHENLSDNRRREIQQALSIEMVKILPFFGPLLQSAGGAAEDSAKEMADFQRQTALRFLSSAADWLEISHLLARPLLTSLSSLLSSSDHFPFVCSILESIANRRSTTIPTEFDAEIQFIWSICFRSLGGLLANSASGSMDSFHFLSLMERVLSALVRNQLDRLIAASATDPAPLNRLYSLLGSLLSHSNVQFTQNSLDLWLLIFRHSQLEAKLLPPPVRVGLIGELAKCVARKLMKPTMEQFEASGIENLEEANRFFGVLRSNLLHFQHRLMLLEPLVCVSVIIQRFDDFLALPPSQDNLNELGYASMRSRKFIEMESCCALLEFLFKDLPSAAWADHRLVAAAGELFNRIARFDPPDPCLQTRRLHAVAQFFPLFESSPALLESAIGILLRGLVFVSPAEQNRAFEDLTEDTQACRRRAIHSLILLGKRVPQLLIPRFSQLSTILEGLKLHDTERSLLVEFQVAVASSLPSIEDQRSLVLSFLQPALQRFGDSRIQRIIGDSAAFRHVIESGEVETMELRSALADCLATLTAVFRILPSSHPCAAIQTQLFAPLCGLISLCYAARPLYQGASCAKHLELAGGSYPPHVKSARKWMDRISEFSLVILGSAAPLIDGPAVAALNALIPSLSSCHSHELRFFLDKFLSPFFRHCPPQHLASALTPAAAAVFTASQALLSAPPAANAANEALEIWNDSELRELARSAADLVAKYVQEIELARGVEKEKEKNEKGGEMASADGSKREGTEFLLLSGIPVFRFLFTETAALPALHSLISLLAFLLVYPDSGAQFRSARFLTRLCAATVDFRCGGAVSAFSPVLRCALLHLAHCDYRPNLVSSLDSEMIGLVKSLIEKIHLEANFGLPREIFLSFPGIDSVSFDSLIQNLKSNQADKKHKNAVKSWLERFVIGKARESENEGKFRVPELPEAVFDQLRALKQGRKQAAREAEMERRGENAEREIAVEAIQGLFH